MSIIIIPLFSYQYHYIIIIIILIITFQTLMSVKQASTTAILRRNATTPGAHTNVNVNGDGEGMDGLMSGRMDETAMVRK